MKESLTSPLSYTELRQKYDYHDPSYAFYYKYIKRPIAYPLTYIVYRYTSFTPNQLTLFGFVCALFAGMSFSQGTATGALIGALLFFLFECADDFDGIVARAKKMGSKRGAWLDFVNGIWGKLAALIGITLGVYTKTGSIHYLMLGIIAISSFLFVSLLDSSIKNYFVNKPQKKLKFAEHVPNAQTLAGKLSILSEMAMNLSFIAIIFGGLFNRLDVTLYYVSIYFPLYALGKFGYRFRQYAHL